MLTKSVSSPWKHCKLWLECKYCQHWKLRSRVCCCWLDGCMRRKAGSENCELSNASALGTCISTNWVGETSWCKMQCVWCTIDNIYVQYIMSTLNYMIALAFEAPASQPIELEKNHDALWCNVCFVLHLSCMCSTTYIYALNGLYLIRIYVCSTVHTG